MESGPDTATRLVDRAENAPAAKLFWTKGYASTTTREIAEVLGVRKASLYHHISCKEDLLFEIPVNSCDLRNFAHIAPRATIAEIVANHYDVVMRDHTLSATRGFLDAA